MSKFARLLVLALLSVGALCQFAQAATAPEITVQPQSQGSPLGSLVSLSVTATGTAPLTYQWQHAGTNLPGAIITTVAGNGTFGFSGDGGAATNAQLSFPWGVAVDFFGNLYIADEFNHRIRKVGTNGVITTIAGNGTAGFTGDGGAATNASLNDPAWVAVDFFGNLYIADNGNSRIRKVTANGIITTVAGNGGQGFSGDGGAATNASLSVPSGVAVDFFGNLYIADQLNSRIRKVNANGIITTVAGNGGQGFSGDGGAATNAQLSFPKGVAVDFFGNLYIACTHNNRIRKVNANGIVSTVAGNGNFGFSGDGSAATNASLASPTEVTVDGTGTLYIADATNRRIRRVGADGIITTVAGDGSGGVASGNGGLAIAVGIGSPYGVVTDAAGNLYFTDPAFGGYGNTVRKVAPPVDPVWKIPALTSGDAGDYQVIVSNASGSVTSQVATVTVTILPQIVSQPVSQVVLAGGTANFGVTATGTPPPTYQWQHSGTNLPGRTGATVAITGVVAADLGGYRVIVANLSGSVTSQVATLTLSVAPAITVPPQSQVTPQGSLVSLSVTATGTGPLTYQWQHAGTNLPRAIITTVAGNGATGFSGDGGAATNASMTTAYGVAVDIFGNLYIADSLDDRIRKVATNGIITTVAGNGNRGFSGDGGAATNARLFIPRGVAVDLFGNLYFADGFNNRIRKVGANGIITTVAGNGDSAFSGDGGAATNASLYFPGSVALDFSGNLYFVDEANNRIRKVAPNGIITTVAGNGTKGFSGDGGAATNASLANPNYVALDFSGNLYISDYGNSRTRKVGTDGIITTVAGGGSSFGDGGAATNASLISPQGLALDFSGNVYISDGFNNRIRKVGTDGIITTVAGNGNQGFSGDGGAATNASLNSPGGMALDAAGNLYFVDYYSYRVRKVALSGEPVLKLNALTAGDLGDYRVIVSNLSGSVTSQVATVSLPIPPQIVVQPQDQFAVLGGVASFAITATGNPPPAYQWQRVPVNLPGKTNATVAITGVLAGDAGGYRVIVTNISGSVTSRVATLTLPVRPQITVDPASQDVTLGDRVTLRVTATGTAPLTYQWRHAGTNLPGAIITTVAGTGARGGAGDGGAATNATLNTPNAVMVDAAGNLYIADYGNNRIRKVGTNGVITTIAGTNTAGYSGDGGAAINAQLWQPYEATADAAGNLYIADYRNNRIRKVGTNGIITTVAGNGTNGYAGDGGAATAANLSNPASVAVDAAGNLYIADAGSNRIRRVGTNGVITTVAGNGARGFSGDGGAATNAQLASPKGVKVDASGNLYIADTLNHKIRRVGADGVIVTVAGTGVQGYAGDGGSATSGARLSIPTGVTVDGAGTLYIADYGNNRIRRVGADGIITTVVGTGVQGSAGDGGSATEAQLIRPSGVALDAAGNLYIADQGNHRIRKATILGSPVLQIDGVALADLGDYEVVVSNAAGSVTSGVAKLTTQLAPLITAQPQSQAVFETATVRLSVSNLGVGPFTYAWQHAGTNLTGAVSSRIETFAGTGTNGYSGDGAAATNALLNQPTSVAVDFFGNVYMADQFNHRIRKVGTNGVITTVAGNGTQGYSGDGGAATNAQLNLPFGLAVDFPGNLYIADTFNSAIRKVGTDGIITTVAGDGSSGDDGDGGRAINATLSYPFGVSADFFGNLYIADTFNSKIRKIGGNGIITTFAGNGFGAYAGDGGAATNASLNNPTGVMPGYDGSVYIADYGNARIRKVGAGGIISTVAGMGSHGYSGDGGAASEAQLALPTAVMMDFSGTLYLADALNSRIRQVETNGIILTVAGNGTAGFSGDGGVATAASLNFPSSVAVDLAGNLYVADQNNQRIRKITRITSPVLTLANVTAADSGEYQVVIRNPYGSVSSVAVTLTVSPPVSTGRADQLSGTSARLKGQALTNAGVTSVGFEWGLTTAYGSSSAPQAFSGNPAQTNFSATATGLLSGTLYHFRAVAATSGGVARGRDQIFLTRSAMTPAGVAAQALFDEPFYLAQHPNVAAAITNGDWASAYDQFYYEGQFNSLRPNTVYDGAFFLSKNPDIAAAVATNAFNSGFEHLAAYGIKEGRVFSKYFDEKAYLALNTNVAALVKAGTFGSGLEYFVKQGQNEKRPLAALFDERWYLQQNPGASNAVASGTYSNAFAHFVAVGFTNRLDYSRYYDEAWYLSNNPDIAANVGPGKAYPSGLYHFLRYGQFEGRTPVFQAAPGIANVTVAPLLTGSAQLNAQVNPNRLETGALFQWGETPAYGQTSVLQNLGDGTASVSLQTSLTGLTPGTTIHYRVLAINELGFSFSDDAVFTVPGGSYYKFFDAAFYLARNPAAAAAIQHGTFATAFDQWYFAGRTNALTPTAEYDEAFYLAQNPDIAAAVATNALTSGFEHFSKYGLAESRVFSKYFDERAYRRLNPNVQTLVTFGVYGSGLEYFIKQGQYTNGLLPALFDETWYLQQNPAVVNALPQYGGDAFTHFIQAGFAQGLDYSRYYNEAWYLSQYSDVRTNTGPGKLYPSGLYHFLALGQFEGRSPIDEGTPVITGVNASPILTSSAGLNAQVNPHHRATMAWFEWGATTSYGKTSVVQNLSNYTVPQSLQASLSGLTPGATIHYRVVATNALGRIASADNQFTVPGGSFAALFDAASYLAQNPPALAAVQSGAYPTALDHYNAVGRQAGLSPNPAYNESFYLAQNPDVAAAVTNHIINSGFEHFAAYGLAEGRVFSKYFDEKAYLALNPDVWALVTNGTYGSGLEYFVQKGQHEYRPLPALYDEAWYLQQNPGASNAVASGAYSNGFAHFIAVGYSQGRDYSRYYDEAWYLSNNPDVAAIVGPGKTYATGLYHFLEFGQFEGRSPVDEGAPIIASLTVDQLFSTSARLNAQVNPHRRTTQAWFEWGATSSYNQTSVVQNLGDGTAVELLQTGLYGLTPGETIHYRVVAANALGTNTTGDAVFTIPGAPYFALFDGAFYVGHHPSVATDLQNGLYPSAFDQWYAVGRLVPLRVSAEYDEAFYLAQNPDVAIAVAAQFYQTGFQHYAAYGVHEGRPASPYYDEEAYLGLNPAVAAAVSAGTYDSGLDYFIVNGQYEQRPLAALYDEAYYLQQNPDVAALVNAHTYASGFAHFIAAGYAQGRDYSPYYSEAVYLSANPDLVAYCGPGKAYPSGLYHFLAYGQFEGRIHR